MCELTCRVSDDGDVLGADAAVEDPLVGEHAVLDVARERILRTERVVDEEDVRVTVDAYGRPQSGVRGWGSAKGDTAERRTEFGVPAFEVVGSTVDVPTAMDAHDARSGFASRRFDEDA